MNDSRMELKVGFFVAAGLALLAVLVLSFSRGLTLFEHTDKLTILLPNAAGLKPTADVMINGVTIGKVTSVGLTLDESAVAVKVSVLKNRIRTNAVVQIDALGFLGDQYISVTPSTNLHARFWADGELVQGRSPFSMLEAVHSVSGLLDQIKATVIDVHQTVSNLNDTVLSDESLSNVSVGLHNAEAAMAAARHTVQGADDLIHANTPAVDAAVTNLLTLTEKLNLTANDLDHLLATNRPGLNETVQNLRDTTAYFKQVAADLQAGKGLAGGLLKDEEMKAEAATLISNVSAMSSAFGAFGSNLNQRGIWSMLWKPKHTDKKEQTPKPAP
jgi:phospholipid/cholesterol/gamma-HCH transport system substrate-binding protein